MAKNKSVSRRNSRNAHGKRHPRRIHRNDQVLRSILAAAQAASAVAALIEAIRH